MSLNNEDSEALTLEEMQAHIVDGSYKYVTFLPVQDRVEDIEYIEVG